MAKENDIIIEGEYPDIEWLATGFSTLDYALSSDRDFGLPLRTPYEIYGPTGTFKTTFAVSLAGIVASHYKKNISFVDLEGLDKEYLKILLRSVGYKGKVHLILRQKDEEALDALLDDLVSEDFASAIFDSIGAFAPVGEIEGEIGDALMGQAAKRMAQFVRRARHCLFYKDNPSLVLMTNHVHPNIGFFGEHTAGGVKKEFLSSVRIRLKKAESFDDGSAIIHGKVNKNRWGITGRTFNLFYLAGKGLHKGLTSVVDAILLKIAEKDRVVKLNDVSYGYFKKDIIASADDPEFFEPFQTAVDKYYKELRNGTPDNTEVEEGDKGS